MRLGSRLLHGSRLARSRSLGVLLGLTVGLGLAIAGPAQSREPLPTTLSLSGAAAYADTVTALQVDLRTDDETPIPAARVRVRRFTQGAWRLLGAVTTDAEGRAALDVTLARRAEDNVFRARYAGDATRAPSATGPVPVRLIRWAGVLVVSGPAHVIDETSVPIRVSWATSAGVPVPGPVALWRRNGTGAWRLFGTLTTGADGRAEVTVLPRVDTRWRAEAARLDWVAAARSAVHAVDNLPPGIPVTLPVEAPAPRITLPPQPRAVGEGANPVIRRIPTEVWQQMKGRSWHRGCPVLRSDLRYLQINYWDFTGYRRRGELVAHRDAVVAMAAALADLYAQQLPLRAMYRVDRFGWSPELHGADNYASMDSDNTSAFNCRQVVGKPGSRSPHAWGRSLDLNPWENPYQSQGGIVPDTWWMTRSHPRVAWRSESHAVVTTMAAHGLSWTYGLVDTQHFDVTG